jgi:hypothetical protein
MEGKMFTLENTDGFSLSDLDIMNAAAALIRDEFDASGIEQYSIEDAIGLCWALVPDTASDLAICAAKRLGIA